MAGAESTCTRFAVTSRTFSRVEFFLALAGRDIHDADGVADHVSGALLSFRAFGHNLSNHVKFEPHVIIE